MRIRRLLAVGAAGVAAALGITTAASALTGSGNAAAPDSLRALAAKTGLRIGTAGRCPGAYRARALSL